MTVRKPRAVRRSRAPRKTGSWATTSGAVGGGELIQAAEEIADGARANASWSKSVPANIRTEQVDENTVLVVSDAGPAYPNETGAPHPLFAEGDRSHWTWRDKAGRPFFNKRPFLAPAAEERADAAIEKFAQVIDRIAADRGFTAQ